MKIFSLYNLEKGKPEVYIFNTKPRKQKNMVILLSEKPKKKEIEWVYQNTDTCIKYTDGTYGIINDETLIW